MILFLAYLLSRWTFQGARWVLRQAVRDRLLASFTARLLSYAVFTAGIALIIRLLGWQDEVATVVAGAGLTVAVLGFAFRDIGENLLAGLFLAASRPFTVSDIVQVGGVEGTVLRINLRYTQLRTFDGRDAFVPNAQVDLSRVWWSLSSGWGPAPRRPSVTDSPTTSDDDDGYKTPQSTQTPLFVSGHDPTALH
jgi:small conductance mechanosensitive channel